MAEWCECKDSMKGGFKRLYSIDTPVVFVHDCGLPTFLVWQKYEKYCDECGRSFSHPTEDVCLTCHSLLLSLQAQGAMGGISPEWLDWKELREKSDSLLAFYCRPMVR